MSRLPLVSVITGYYNRKENLLESVQSILDQTYLNLEYIIFDDCSTDGTYELLKEFKTPKLVLIRHEVNIGFTKGMISAISRSKGDLIAIHGAGDFSFKERISKQVDVLINKPEVGIVGCLLENVSNEGTIIHSPNSDGLNHNFTQGEVIYRKSLYDRVGGYNSLFKYGQFTILKREILKLSSPDFVNEVLYRRIHYPNGVTENKSKIIEQRIYIRIGSEISETENIFTLDMSNIVITTCLNYILLLKKESKDEKLFLFHIKKRSHLITLLYKFYRWNLLPARLFRFISLKLL